MVELVWNGFFGNKQFRDMGSPGDREVDPRAYNVTGVQSSYMWVGDSNGGTILGTPDPDIILLDEDAVAYLGPRLVNIDRFFLGGGNDVLNLGSARHSYIDTSAWGGAGDDWMFGNDGKDEFYGEDGNDRLKGYAGEDRLFGGLGNDTLDGGNGNDWLSGGIGVDTLTGELGSDTFVFTWSDLHAGANDTVTDYSAAAGDVLKVIGGYSSLVGVTFSGSEAVLSLGQATNSIQLASGSFVTVEWHPTETANDFANAVVLRFAVPGQQAWSQYTQLYDAAGRFDVETGAYANGSGWLYDVDQANAGDLRYFRNEFSTNHTLTSQLGQYDDGRQWLHSYGDGQLVSTAWTDVENTGGWAKFTDFYDLSNGRLDYETGNFDGSGGWLYDVDQNNTSWMRYFRNEFTDSFTLTRQVGQTDDGRIWEDLYDNGRLSKTQWTDAENTQVWSTVTDTYGDYGNGHTVQRLYMFDDGSHAWQLL